VDSKSGVFYEKKVKSWGDCNMGFNVLAFLYTIGCCVVAMVIAGMSGSDEDKEWFVNLNHPDNAFLLKIMNIVGIIFFSSFGFVLYHLFIKGDAAPIILAILIILLMGLSPALKYKTRNLKVFFLIMLLFPVLTVGLLWFLLPNDFVIAIPVIVFSLWLVYDLSYYYRLMQLNR